MVGDDLLFRSERQVLHTSILLLEVDVAETTIEEYFARVELELQTQLLIVDVVVPAEVKQGVVEVGQRFLEITHEEVGHTLLEIGDGEVLIQPHSALVAVDLDHV